MDMFALPPVQPDPAIVPIKTLELAPEGWRACVQRVAEGYAEVIGEHAYCLNCGKAVHGAQGHDVSCLTMVARRILVNEPYLHAQRHTSVSLQGVDIDAVHKSVPAPISIPIFLTLTTTLAG
jgi:hypothetical protein